jgi:hypothetical protein
MACACLQDIGVARQLVELGVINHLFSAIIPRSLFDTRKKERGGDAAVQVLHKI